MKLRQFIITNKKNRNLLDILRIKRKQGDYYLHTLHIVSNMPVTAEQTHRFSGFFNSLDIDGDGVLEKHDFVLCAQKYVSIFIYLS